MPSIAPIYDDNDFVKAVNTKLNNFKQSTKKPLLSVLLYTEEDKELAPYIRQHYTAFDKMSGPNCDVFVIERPIYAAYPEQAIVNLAGRRTEQDLPYRKPFNKAAALDIARRLNIFADQLPCIAFFENLEATKDVVVFPIQGDLTVFFRILFGSIDRQLHYAPENTKFIFSDIRLKLSRLGHKTTDDHGQVSYIYNGQTFYINHVDTIRKSVVDLGENNNIGDISMDNIAGGDINVTD